MYYVNVLRIAIIFRLKLCPAVIYIFKICSGFIGWKDKNILQTYKTRFKYVALFVLFEYEWIEDFIFISLHCLRISLFVFVSGICIH